MKSFKRTMSFLLAGTIVGSSLGMFSLNASAASITNGQEYTKPVTVNASSLNQLETESLQSTMMKWNMTVSSDMLGITKKLSNVLQNTTFKNVTREITDQTFSLTNSRYNVMMITTDSNFHYQFQDIKFHASLNYYGMNYDVYVFESGIFDKYNHVETQPWAWAYKGWIKNENSGSNIHFYLPKMGA
ncbi:hypothetical protein FA950_29215 [Bacillus thuringiensis]|uniref:hypothetical protein n=1 Tax=Bacillus thuringiensis TaxID=1428 RepID=UPI0010AD441F|nr:hypothetical protein [Bacillus thuringiensis]TJZ99963.1 hypothetical protein FA950_29215 [Bacillus thuringiensis]